MLENKSLTELELSLLVQNLRRANEELPIVRLSNGDLAKTLGIKGEAEKENVGRDEMPLKEVGQKLNKGELPKITGESPIQEIVCDIGSALLDGKLYWFTSHLMLWNKRPGNFSGHFLAVMNAAWWGELNLSVRAHPGDGKLDSFESNLGFREAQKMKARARTGTHLPHPKIKTTRLVAETFEFEKARSVYLDNVEVTKAKTIAVRIEPAKLKIRLQ